MIEQKASHRDDLLEFHLSGKITDADYEQTVIPAVEQALENHDRIRVLVTISDDFEGYTASAAFDDAKLGFKYWRGFDRMALVGGPAWMSGLVRTFAIFMPCPVKSFKAGEDEDARRWLVESLGSIHHEDLGRGVLHLSLMGQLDPALYAAEREELDAFLAENQRFKLLLDLREFDGWENLAAIGAHVKLVSDYHRQVDRVALVGDKAWQRMAERVVGNLVNAETRFFPGEEFDQAGAWLAG